MVVGELSGLLRLLMRSLLSEDALGKAPERWSVLPGAEMEEE